MCCTSTCTVCVTFWLVLRYCNIADVLWIFWGSILGCRVHTHPVWSLLSVCLSAILILYTVLLLVDILFIMSLGHPASVQCTCMLYRSGACMVVMGCGGGGGLHKFVQLNFFLHVDFYQLINLRFYFFFRFPDDDIF